MTSSFGTVIGTPRDKLPDIRETNYDRVTPDLSESVNKQIDNNIADFYDEAVNLRVNDKIKGFHMIILKQDVDFEYNKNISLFTNKLIDQMNRELFTKIAVVGGGNTAVEEALYLSNICSKVTLIHRRDELRSEKILQDRLFSKENINIIWNNVVSEILGDENGVSSLKLTSTKQNKKVVLKVEGVFIAIGHTPSTKPF